MRLFYLEMRRFYLEMKKRTLISSWYRSDALLCINKIFCYFMLSGTFSLKSIYVYIFIFFSINCISLILHQA